MIATTTKPEQLGEMSCQFLKGVGPQLAAKLAKRDIHTVQDLLFHLPLRYQDRTQITQLGHLRMGLWAVVEGTITDISVKRRPRPMLECTLEDGSGSLCMRLFHFAGAQLEQLTLGKTLRCFGEVRWRKDGYEMVHPEYRCSTGPMPALEEALTPIYPTTEGLTQPRLRAITDLALDLLAQGGVLDDYLPPHFCKAYGLPNLKMALQTVHRPALDTDLELMAQGHHPAQRRLAFEEMLAHCLSLQTLRQSIQTHAAPILKPASTLVAALKQSLPYQLTGAQQRVMKEISCDLNQNFPMLRLVQGDVGSGKTIVAALAALQAVEAGYQVALMAPTELLAEQHHKNFQNWLMPLQIPLAWLTGSLTEKNKNISLQNIANGSAKIVIGTHALFQKQVSFSKLGLIIIDEQHRFGVEQRLQLWEKGSHHQIYPHQLLLSATPIPRTLAMTAYADLDCSVIDELPPGRQPITTVAISSERRGEVVERVRAICLSGQQAYWVCTLIEESEVLEAQAAEEAAIQLVLSLPELKIGLIHGRLPAAEKDLLMQAFKRGDIQLLVATTVIEVGVDVPNATLMVIENPERLGLAQLHQLRGRIGRGKLASYCVLLYKQPLSKDARTRLSVLRESQDGFVIAQKDLEIRGPGEMLGTRQTGEAMFRVANVLRDQTLMPEVRKAAEQLLKDHPKVVEPLIRRWLGNAERFARV